MKKIVLLIMLAVMSTVGFAQVPFIIKGGVGLSTITGDDLYDFKAKAAWKIGVGTEFQMAPDFYLQPTLYFVNKGAKSDRYTVASVANVNATINANYLELPVMFEYKAAVASDMNVVFSAGPYFSYGIGGKTNVKAQALGLKVNLASLNTFDYEDGYSLNLKKYSDDQCSLDPPSTRR